MGHSLKSNGFEVQHKSGRLLAVYIVLLFTCPHLQASDDETINLDLTTPGKVRTTRTQLANKIDQAKSSQQKIQVLSEFRAVYWACLLPTQSEEYKRLQGNVVEIETKIKEHQEQIEQISQKIQKKDIEFSDIEVEEDQLTEHIKRLEKIINFNKKITQLNGETDEQNLSKTKTELSETNKKQHQQYRKREIACELLQLNGKIDELKSKIENKNPLRNTQEIDFTDNENLATEIEKNSEERKAICKKGVITSREIRKLKESAAPLKQQLATYQSLHQESFQKTSSLQIQIFTIQPDSIDSFKHSLVAYVCSKLTLLTVHLNHALSYCQQSISFYQELISNIWKNLDYYEATQTSFYEEVKNFYQTTTTRKALIESPLRPMAEMTYWLARMKGSEDIFSDNQEIFDKSLKYYEVFLSIKDQNSEHLMDYLNLSQVCIESAENIKKSSKNTLEDLKQVKALLDKGSLYLHKFLNQLFIQHNPNQYITQSLKDQLIPSMGSLPLSSGFPKINAQEIKEIISNKMKECFEKLSNDDTPECLKTREIVRPQDMIWMRYADCFKSLSSLYEIWLKSFPNTFEHALIAKCHSGIIDLCNFVLSLKSGQNQGGLYPHLAQVCQKIYVQSIFGFEQRLKLLDFEQRLKLLDTAILLYQEWEDKKKLTKIQIILGLKKDLILQGFLPQNTPDTSFEECDLMRPNVLGIFERLASQNWPFALNAKYKLFSDQKIYSLLPKGEAPIILEKLFFLRRHQCRDEFLEYITQPDDIKITKSTAQHFHLTSLLISYKNLPSVKWLENLQLKSLSLIQTNLSRSNGQHTSAIGTLTLLEQLDLSKNKFSEIPDFKKLDKLEILSLNGNQVTDEHLRPVIRSLTSLKKLYLTGNCFIKPHDYLFSILNPKILIELSGNPLSPEARSTLTSVSKPNWQIIISDEAK